MPRPLFYPQARAILSVVFEGFGGGSSDPQIIPVLPQSLSVQRNSYKQADSWSMTFDAADLPIPPELIAAGSCETFLFESQNAPDRTRLVDRRLRELKLGNFRPARDAIDEIQNEISRAGAQATFADGNRPLIVGLFDEATLEYSSSGRTVSIEGQDYTALLLEKQWPPTDAGRARRIPTGQKLDELMSALIREADPTGGLKLRLRELTPADIPVVRGDRAKLIRKGIPISADTSYWDVLYKLATFMSFICFIDGLDVVLTRPQNIMDRGDIRTRKFVWGKNLSRILMRRHMGKERVPQIKVVSYDEQARTPIEAVFPAKGQKVPTGTGVEKDAIEVIPAAGVQDPALLAKIAEAHYNLRARPEMTVTIETRDLADVEGDDLLNLRNGDKVEIRFEPFNRDLLRRLNLPERVGYLVNRGYGQEISEFIASNYEHMDVFNDPFRVRAGSLNYAANQGVDIQLELIRFVRLGGISSGDNA